MQVQQIEDTTDTFAAVGKAAGKDLEFSVSNSAAFYSLISKAIYTNELMAALREPICNGWDSHIKNGKTDIPMEITVTATHVIIKDFGSGIPHDKFAKVALSYGDSTKVESVDETGGFGLGFKAPFANGHTFNCTNCYGGIKNVFEMQSAEISDTGKPKAIQVISVPTEETGITIQMPLNNGQYGTALDYVLRICIFGGIRAKVNGTLLSYYPSEDCVEGFICWWSEFVDGNTRMTERITIRYGSVVYPLPRAIINFKSYTHTPNADETELEKLTRLNAKAYLNLINNGISKPFTLIAKSGSLTIMPSREELSESLANMRVINELLTGFTDQLSTRNFLTESREKTHNYLDGELARLNQLHNNNPYLVYSSMLRVGRVPMAAGKTVLHTVKDLNDHRWSSAGMDTQVKVDYINNKFNLHLTVPTYELPSFTPFSGVKNVQGRIRANYGILVRKFQRKLLKLGIIPTAMGVTDRYYMRPLSELAHRYYNQYDNQVANVMVIGFTDRDITNLDCSLEDGDPNSMLTNIGKMFYYKVTAAAWRKHSADILKYAEESGFYVIDATKLREQKRKEQAEINARFRAEQSKAPVEKQERLFNAWLIDKKSISNADEFESLLYLDIGLRGNRYNNHATGHRSGTIKMVHRAAFVNKHDGNLFPGAYGGNDIATGLAMRLNALAAIQKVGIVNTIPRYNALIKDGAKDWTSHIYEQIKTLVDNAQFRKIVQYLRNFPQSYHRVSENIMKLMVQNKEFYDKYFKKLSPYPANETAILLYLTVRFDSWKATSSTDTPPHSDMAAYITRPVPDSVKLPIPSSSPFYWYMGTDSLGGIPENAIKHILTSIK